MIRPKKLPRDPNQRAHEIGRLLTEGAVPEELVTDKTEYLAEIGRKGGQKGGKARTERLSAKRRSEIAKKAARKRWGH